MTRRKTLVNEMTAAIGGLEGWVVINRVQATLWNARAGPESRTAQSSKSKSA
jgi:hypothetical protein